jgi:hypothetical protein
LFVAEMPDNNNSKYRHFYLFLYLTPENIYPFKEARKDKDWMFRGLCPLNMTNQAVSANKTTSPPYFNS